MPRRPKNDDGREKALTVRMTADEYAKIEQKAAKHGLSLSDYVRLVTLNADIKVVVKKPAE